jgi:putative salt-induced outer membrane protein YdiY
MERIFRARGRPLVLVLALVMNAASLFAQSEPAPAPPVKSWSTSLGTGYSMSKGNSNSSNVNVAFNTSWDPKTVRTFKIEVLYISESKDNEQTVDKTSALIRYQRRFMSKNQYLFAESSYTRDSFKDIASLISPRVGIGINVEKSERTKLSFDLSAGTATERNLAGKTSTGGAAQIGETLDLAFGSTKLTQKASALFKTGDFNDTIYHVDAGVTASLAKHFDMKFTYIFEYKTQPEHGDVLNSDTSMVATLLLKW